MADLAHAAFNGRGNYINAAGSSTLTAQAQRLAQSIATGVGSTTPVAVNTQVARVMRFIPDFL